MSDEEMLHLIEFEKELKEIQKKDLPPDEKAEFVKEIMCLVREQSN